MIYAKLEHYGIHGIANEWFKFYFFDKKQFVSINGHVSNKASINYSVPQGSVFGPILFLIYINDFNHPIKFSKVHHFLLMILTLFILVNQLTKLISISILTRKFN